jgi:hypothetical protein
MKACIKDTDWMGFPLLESSVTFAHCGLSPVQPFISFFYLQLLAFIGRLTLPVVRPLANDLDRFRKTEF